MRWWVGLVLAIGACTGGASVSGGGFAGGSSGASGSESSPPNRADPPQDAQATEVPFVACSLDDLDAASDADADVADADIADADGPPPHADGGPEHPCATPPPPECAGPTTMVVFSSEGCDGERCLFRQSLVGCPGGCFRQMDGGNRCND